MNKRQDWERELTAKGVQPWHKEWGDRKRLELRRILDDFIQQLDDPSYDAVDWEQGNYSDHRREVFTRRPTKALHIDIEAIRAMSYDLSEYDCDEETGWDEEQNDWHRLRRAVNARFRYALGESDD